MKCDCCLKKLNRRIEQIPTLDEADIYYRIGILTGKLNEVIDRINESESTNITLCNNCSKKGYEIEVEKKEKILEDIDKIRTILGTKEKDE